MRNIFLNENHTIESRPKQNRSKESIELIRAVKKYAHTIEY